MFLLMVLISILGNDDAQEPDSSTTLKPIFWVKSGVISIRDLGNEFLLVKFSNDGDRNYALRELEWARG